jgi:lysophospholipase
MITPDMQTTPYHYLLSPDGLKLRYGHWQCGHRPCQGTVVVLGGRGEFAEKYHETITDLLDRGFDAFCLDWRGQGLSQRLLPDASKGYVQSYDQYICDLDFFLETTVSDKGRAPFLLMAHSMGANIALQLLRRSPGKIHKAVLLAPMVDIQTAPIPGAVVRWCSQLSLKLGWETANIPMLRYDDTYRRSFESNHLTHDRKRFDTLRKMLEENSQLAVGNITFGWLAATLTAIDRLGRPDFLAPITTPLLWVLAGRDRVVSNGAARVMAGRIPSSWMVTIDGAYHEILQEQDQLRDQFWKAFDPFVSG